MSVLFLHGELVLFAELMNAFPGDHSIVNRWKGPNIDIFGISDSPNVPVMKLMKPVGREARDEAPNRISIRDSQNQDSTRLQPSVEVIKHTVSIRNVFEHIGVVDDVITVRF